MTNQQPPAYTPAQPLSQSDERLWSTLTHVGGIFFSFIPSLIVYLVFKERSQFLRDNSRNALNFQITFAAVQAANFIVGIVLTAVTAGLWGIIQLLIYLAALVIVVIFSILGAVAANRGEVYRYPLTIAIIK